MSDAMKILVLANMLFCTIMLIPSILYAAEDSDTRLRLEQNLLAQQQEQQQNFRQQQEQDGLSRLTLNGQIIVVENNVHDVGQALYLAVMQKHWSAVQYYLEMYRGLAAHDQSLLQFAQGALARAEGKLQQAEIHFVSALELEPNNVMIQLEMARLLTELKKNQAAIVLFKQIQQQLNPLEQSVAQNILASIDMYLNALTQRDSWQGNISVGTRYATNINSTSEKSTTWTRYLENVEGQKIPVEQITRSTPQKINAQALDYEAAVNKRWSLQGQHGLAMKAFSYGRSYAQQQRFNEMTLALNAGYSFQNPKHQVFIAPVFEHRRYHNDSLSNAWGARAEWLNLRSNQQAIKVEAEVKQIEQQLFKSQSGLEFSAYATYWKILNPKWMFFAGLDLLDHNTEERYFSAYLQQGLRLGVTQQWGTGFQATVFGSLRWRQYDQFNAVLSQKRADFEQNYQIVLRAEQWQFYGLTPNLSYQYNRNQSNVDWLYSYDKHQLSLKLDYRF